MLHLSSSSLVSLFETVELLAPTAQCEGGSSSSARTYAFGRVLVTSDRNVQEAPAGNQHLLGQVTALGFQYCGIRAISLAHERGSERVSWSLSAQVLSGENFIGSTCAWGSASEYLDMINRDTRWPQHPLDGR